MKQSREVKGGVDKSVMPTARPCSTEENNSRCRKSYLSCLLWECSVLGLGVLAEEDRSKATEGVASEPEFARKKLIVGVSTGLCTTGE